MHETELILEGSEGTFLLPPLSARACHQTLSLIPQGELRRTLNGTLVCLGRKGHRKFCSTISCQDKCPPAFGKLWVGESVKVGCLQSLTQSAFRGPCVLALERVPRRGYAHDQTGKMWPLDQVGENRVALPAVFPGGFITYYPWLAMRVKHYHLETNEWEETVGWRLELEEE